MAGFPGDPRMAEATFVLGKTRLALGEPQAALLLLRRVQTVDPPPPWRVDARFWEGEALFRLKNYAEARAAYDDLLRTNAASPLAADALYGMAFADVEMGQRARGADEFGEFLKTWPQHPLVPSATYNQARVLIDLKRSPEGWRSYRTSRPGFRTTSSPRTQRICSAWRGCRVATPKPALPICAPS